ncbi:hypothetical protein SAMN02745857_03892 [Andreprevotia lacus DSM 23236]|jgi:hypothetical protein|uniref:Uncharacterized protein n=1 Tax=Andreprevotia lacus DSM 23236 TaxID=1121001 RepID=A0A1W1Y031_9NEIS|nr:hypothetical protein [Andreprevotia lacus]SMC29523.1 hypothetical protein SAMN02745857_03892 [Andreprevotia lacus DSM 23236]
MARPPRKLLGVAACPCCGLDAPVKEQGNGYAILVCGMCDGHVQAKSPQSDAKLRAKIKQPQDEKVPEVAPPAHAAPAPAPPRKQPNPAAPREGGSFLDALGGLLAGAS